MSFLGTPGEYIARYEPEPMVVRTGYVGGGGRGNTGMPGERGAHGDRGPEGLHGYPGTLIVPFYFKKKQIHKLLKSTKLKKEFTEAGTNVEKQRK